MLKWMCRLTNRDTIRKEHTRATTGALQVSKKTRDTFQIVQLCAEEKSTTFGRTGKEKRVDDKHNMELSV